MPEGSRWLLLLAVSASACAAVATPAAASCGARMRSRSGLLRANTSTAGSTGALAPPGMFGRWNKTGGHERGVRALGRLDDHLDEFGGDLGAGQHSRWSVEFSCFFC